MTAARLLKIVGDDDTDSADPVSPDETFEQFLDDQCTVQGGMIEIAGMLFRPSFVLKMLDPQAYNAAYGDYRDDLMRQLVETVRYMFPSPIAYCFHMSEHGWENDHQRLQFLRDTWEASVRFIHALLIGEAREMELDLQDSGVNYSDLFSDKLTTLMINIERIIKYADSRNTPLSCMSWIGVDFAEQLRSLNRLRNDFSHAQAKSEQQVIQIIDDAIRELIPIFASIEELKSLTLMRIRDQRATTIRREIYRGFSLARQVDAMVVPSEIIATAYTKTMPYLAPENMLAYWDSKFVCLTPFIHYQLSDSGHTTKVMVLKARRSGGMLAFEVLGESRELTLPQADFTSHLDEIRALFGLRPDS